MMVISCLSVFTFVYLVVQVEDQIEVLSLHHWLDSETTRYFAHQEAGVDYIPNPDEFDYYTSDKKMPAWLSNYKSPGFFEHELGPEDRHFLVSAIKNSEHYFYLVFRDNADDYLDNYESQLKRFIVILAMCFFLMMVLFSVYVVRFITKPFAELHSKVDKITPNSPDFVCDAKYQEFQVIESALFESKKRIERFFTREQEFSRFAAHEIRTPLMVLKGSSELLNQISLEQPLVKKAIGRISNASDDISLLINTFLLLGQEKIDEHFFKQVQLNDIVKNCIDEAKKTFHHRQLTIGVELVDDVVVNVPPEFIKVLVSNLLKNSFTYASDNHQQAKLKQTDIDVVLTGNTLSVSNVYDEQEVKSGYGYGLVIVKRICQRLQWQFRVDKTANEFTITIEFNH